MHKFSQYTLKRNYKKYKKEFGEALEDFSMSYMNLPLIQKLDELIQKEVTFYKQNSRQRCFKCRKYGHIAKECPKICQTCGFFHPGKVCLTNLIKNFQEVICINYMSFARQYDRICQSIENITKHSFYSMKVTPCQQLQIKPTHLVRVVEYETKEELIGEVNEINAIFNVNLTKALYKIKADYAHKNKVDIKSIKLDEKICERFDIRKGIAYEIIPEFKKNNFLQFMGSGIYATMYYKLEYEKADIVTKEEFCKIMVYNRIKKEKQYNINPVFKITQGHNLQYNYKYNDKLRLERFNKMLRLYTSKDKLEVKKTELEIANKQLLELNSLFENKMFDYIQLEEKTKIKLEGLKQYYKEVHQKLKERTQQAKQKNIDKLNQVKSNCIKQAKEAVKKKKEYIAKAEEALNGNTDGAIFSELSRLFNQLKTNNIKFTQCYNTNGKNVIYYQYSNTDSKSDKRFEFPDLGSHVIKTWKDGVRFTFTEDKKYFMDFISEHMNLMKIKRVRQKDVKQRVVNLATNGFESSDYYDSESDSDC